MLEEMRFRAFMGWTMAFLLLGVGTLNDFFTHQPWHGVSGICLTLFAAAQAISALTVKERRGTF